MTLIAPVQANELFVELSAATALDRLEGDGFLFQRRGPRVARLALTAHGLMTRIADQNALPDWIRVTVGTEQAMHGFVRALQAVARAGA